MKPLARHPDRHVNASDYERRENEKKYKEVGEALKFKFKLV
jgi:hypothetical protein